MLRRRKVAACHRMREKVLATIRTRSQGILEEEMAAIQHPEPADVWETSVVTEGMLEVLVERGMLKPKEQVGWRAAAGEQFPSEHTDETVIFLAHVERGFGVPTGDFFRGLLHHYRIEAVNLTPNSITLVSDFIHLCEAYLGVPAHIKLWRHYFELKRTGKNKVVGALSFSLRKGFKDVYIDMELPDSNHGWRSGWFYIGNHPPDLERTGAAPVAEAEWTSLISSREVEAIQPLIDAIASLKERGLNGGTVACNFARRLIQPIQDRVHPAYEYWGQADPTRMKIRKVSKAEMTARVKCLYSGAIRNKGGPKAFCLVRPPPPVRDSDF